MRPHLIQLFLFAVAGIIGFLVDTAVLYILAPYMGPFYARILSFLAAVLTTWIVNRALAFRNQSSTLSKKSEFTRYLILMMAGGLINYAVYSSLIVYSLLVRQYLVLGVAAGSLAGMVVNYLSSRFLIYRFPSS
ncbi:GtrA family protein [Candidimonas nitroreducens]|uniref:Polysaccharide synthesis protein GtrA n=1 Tax=Candidimonas nitroreducens TaxID=683354 RepID=A0A225MVL2_9BURK|nr:GtrA family protein [Candidimonas nitroreducens]OWT63860.1 polysaccharide synthesis protein GtrA [Candidimonas nitroreducens]